MRLASRILALALVGACLSVTSSPAVASCAAGAGPAGSPTIFLGVAGDTSGGYTTMTVEEVESTTSSEGAMSLRPNHVRKPLIGTDDVGDPESSKPIVIASLVLAVAIGAVAAVVRVRDRR